MTKLPPPEQAASEAVHLLLCPVCLVGEAACRPKDGVDGVRFECLHCGFEVTSPCGTKSGWRDGALAWNREARKA